MILYNVTIKIDQDVEREWLQWMRKVHIPEVMQTGCFLDNSIFRLKFPPEDEGVTYAIQYHCKDLKTLDLYHSRYAAELQRAHTEKFLNRFVSFRTILEQVS